MKLEYQFKESGGNQPAYLLILNDRVIKTYLKTRFSRQDAEDRASDEVARAIKKHGVKNVSYDGYLINA